MRYVVEQEFDNRAFAAALVDAGVKGHVRLVEEKGLLFFGGDKYIEGRDRRRSAPLEPAEAAGDRSARRPGRAARARQQEPRDLLGRARRDLESAFESRFDGQDVQAQLRLGRRSAFVGLAGRRLSDRLVASCSAEGSIPSLVAARRPWSLGVAAFLLCRLGKSAPGSAAGAGCWSSILAAFVGSAHWAVILPIGARQRGAGQPIVAGRCSGCRWPCRRLFWISAPTKEGRACSTGSRASNNICRSPSASGSTGCRRRRDTLQMFERYLPYAIALGVENRWADRFAGQLAAAAAAGQPGLRLVFGIAQPVDRHRRLRQFARLVAVELDFLGLDRAGLVQRLGRRRIVGRWRRRRWRRRLVSQPRRGAPAGRSARRGRSPSAPRSKPSRSRKLDRRRVCRRDDRHRSPVGLSLARPSRAQRAQASRGHAPGHGLRRRRSSPARAARRSTGQVARWKSNKPTWPTSLPSDPRLDRPACRSLDSVHRPMPRDKPPHSVFLAIELGDRRRCAYTAGRPGLPT